MYYPQAHQQYSWKRFIYSCLFKVWLLILASPSGCFHASQVTADNEAAFHPKMRPIDIDSPTAEKIGKESLEKFGYEKIMNLADRAGFVSYKLNVGIQLASYESPIVTGFVPVFSRYAVAAAVASQADSPLPGPADIAAVGVVVVGLVDAGLLDGYLFNTLEGWLFSKAKDDEAAGVAKAVEREVKEAERALKSNQDFRRWFHREYKADQVTATGSRTNPDLSPEQVRDAYQEWLQASMPKVK